MIKFTESDFAKIYEDSSHFREMTEERLPIKGITLENYLDLVINNENYEDSEAFLGISGLISEKELTSKIDYVSELAKQETQSNNQ